MTSQSMPAVTSSRGGSAIRRPSHALTQGSTRMRCPSTSMRNPAWPSHVSRSTCPPRVAAHRERDLVGASLDDEQAQPSHPGGRGRERSPPCGSPSIGSIIRQVGSTLRALLARVGSGGTRSNGGSGPVFPRRTSAARFCARGGESADRAGRPWRSRPWRSPGPWIASPVESKRVISSSDCLPGAVPASTPPSSVTSSRRLSRASSAAASSPPFACLLEGAYEQKIVRPRDRRLPEDVRRPRMSRGRCDGMRSLNLAATGRGRSGAPASLQARPSRGRRRRGRLRTRGGRG
jgi:hypothetical protein